MDVSKDADSTPTSPSEPCTPNYSAAARTASRGSSFGGDDRRGSNIGRSGSRTNDFGYEDRTRIVRELVRSGSSGSDVGRSSSRESRRDVGAVWDTDAPNRSKGRGLASASEFRHRMRPALTALRLFGAAGTPSAKLRFLTAAAAAVEAAAAAALGRPAGADVAFPAFLAVLLCENDPHMISSLRWMELLLPPRALTLEQVRQVLSSFSSSFSLALVAESPPAFSCKTCSRTLVRMRALTSCMRALTST